MAVDTKVYPPIDEVASDHTRAETSPAENSPYDESLPAARGLGSQNSGDVSRDLVQRVEHSAQSLRHASAGVENRGLKLLLKVLAQERVYMHNALRQSSGYRAVDPLDPSEKSPATALQEGLQELQSSMAVQQQGREHVALSHLLDEEEKLVDAYDAAISDEHDLATRNLLTEQRDQIARFVTRLRGVDFSLEPIVARVFDHRIEGENAVAQLQARGLDASRIDLFAINPIEHSDLYRTSVEVEVTPKNSPQKTMIAGALVGALCGGIFGLALAAFVWMTPQWVGWVTVPAWQFLLGSIIAGAAGGTVFGFFIGQNQKEIDQSVTVDGLVNGEILVVAYPLPSQREIAEEVLRVHHARELRR